MMSCSRGDVVLLLFPHSDLITAKRRPALIVQSDNIETEIQQKVVAMMTSNLWRKGPTRVHVQAQSEAGKAMGIKVDSVVVCDNLATVLTAQIDEVIGRCPTMKEVDESLRAALALKGIERRPIGLAIVLIIVAAANIFGLIFGLTHREEFFTQFPRFTPELWTVYLLCPPIAIAALAALWFWRKWGLWLAYLVGALVFGIELYALPFGWHLARIIVSVGLITFFAKRAWQRFL
jgi:mRNA interferase MazF